MKPFSLEAALKGALILDRGGNPVEFITYVEKANQDSRVVALHSDGNVFSTSVAGRYWGTDDSPRDLFMAPVKHTVWVNLYPRNKATYFASQEEADKGASDSRISNTAFKIEFES